jgi:ferredoxin
VSAAPVVRVAPARCTACGLCLITCPARALAPAARHPVVAADRCDACGDCVEVCPRDALSLEPPGRPA